MTAGFMLMPLVSDQKCCFCPACSKHLDQWRKRTIITPATADLLSQEQSSCGSQSTCFRAQDLLAHVKDKADKADSGCWWHWLVYEYLQRMFRHYMGKDRPHKAFLDPNSSEVSTSVYCCVRINNRMW